MQLKTPFPLAITPPIPPHSRGSGAPAVETEVSAGGVNIFHSGYQSYYSPLLYFPTFDDGGIDYNLAYLACCILVGNAWPRSGDDSNCPYLAESCDRTAPRVSRPPDGILRKSSYYLFVPACPKSEFPITPNFSNWVFPHGNLPDIFRDIVIHPVPWHKVQNMSRVKSEAIAARDECCRVTQAFSGSQWAHIIPRSRKNWFLMNNMSRYSKNKGVRPSVDDINNGIYLRSDINHMLDQAELVMFPKYTGERYELVLHVLRAQAPYFFEQRDLYHNRKLQDVYGISREFLFARFAWSIFQDNTVRIFETQQSPFEISILKPAVPGTEPQTATKRIESASELATATSSFAESGRVKRSRGAPDGPFDDECRWVYSVRKERMVCLTDEEEEEEDVYDDDECRWVYSVRKERMVCLTDEEEEDVYEDGDDATDIDQGLT
ncbi:hypothetical protein F5B19DRAFT_493708 [Rostrohypoxylon terebratum]|nr:hypothetical protein F5B19DRAFT_493708 [Rostrohypoxylon terebratum]